MPSKRKFTGLGNLHRPDEPLALSIRPPRASDASSLIPPSQENVSTSSELIADPLAPPYRANPNEPYKTPPSPPVTVEWLEATHTAAGHELYLALYSETHGRGISARAFTHSDVRPLLSRKNPITYAKALRELISKNSIEFQSRPMGKHGRIIKVLTPAEIVTSRQDRHITIDPKSKRVISARRSPKRNERRTSTTTRLI